jgi:hypothetical protein
MARKSQSVPMFGRTFDLDVKAGFGLFRLRVGHRASVSTSIIIDVHMLDLKCTVVVQLLSVMKRQLLTICSSEHHSRIAKRTISLNWL